MKRAIQTVKRFLVEENGPTAVEYAVMIGLIIFVAVAGISTFGTNLNTWFNGAATSVATLNNDATP